MGNSIKRYWHTWLWRDAVTKLITVNSIVWLAVILWLAAAKFMPDADTLYYWAYSALALPSGLHDLAFRPWTVLTYMFTQYDFTHLLVNMLWLLLFGRLFMQSQSGDRLVTLYIYGGLAGALTFVICQPEYQYLIGSSCAVLAVTGAASVTQPHWRVNLLIIGPVSVIWVALVAAIFYIVLSESMVQSLAHGAGAAVGVAYGLLRRRGIDITAPVMTVINSLRSRRTLTAQPQRTSGRAYSSAEEELDSLLDKVRLYGYSSLSAQQRQRLFDLSQKIRR